MKITVKILDKTKDATLHLQWQMPGEDSPSHLYILPSELHAQQYPHTFKDMSRLAAFYGDRLVLFYAPDGTGRCVDAVCTARVDEIFCDTFKLLEVLKKLHARQVMHSVLDTDRFRRDRSLPTLTIGQLAAHPNLRNADQLGRTLKHFWQLLAHGGGKRTFADLMRDLSVYVQRARLFAHSDEFYFDGRYPEGCGFNGGIVPHDFDHSYGIHT